MKRGLDALVREARAELGAREAQDVDWNAVDEALFARIEAEERRARREASPSPAQARGWTLAAAAMAAALAGIVVIGKSREGRTLDAKADAPSRIAATVSSGEGLVAGRPAGAGSTLRAGDALEARGAVRLESPGKVWLVLEPGSLARVEDSRGALLLSLDRGAVEADVNPVAAGEAFAIDVAQGDGRVRIAVHGTHLRVARIGERVTVDLNEGVISVGAPPRAGSTFGTLVTAPAHAEFSASDAAGTLTVSHDPSRVRAPVALRPGPAPRPALTPAPAASGAAQRLEGQARPSAAMGATVARAEGRPPLAAADSAGPAASPSASPAPAGEAVDPNPDATLSAAFRACLPPRAGADDQITLVVSTTLRIELNDDGTVRSARFDPPVAPEVNSCVAPSIYKTRFGHGGSESLPIDVTFPSSAR